MIIIFFFDRRIIGQINRKISSMRVAYNKQVIALRFVDRIFFGNLRSINSA